MKKLLVVLLALLALGCAAAVAEKETTYQSARFEYALLERPVLFFAYDLGDYDDWRGFYYPYEEMTPGPVLRTNEEIARELLHLEKEFDPAAIRAFRDKFMSACDGRAAERILKLITEKAKA